MQRALLDWAAVHGRRLAFRATDDAYRVLVAETMAQQTQVSRVEATVAAFLAQFPTVEALASASAADVLRAWRGLGYNRRALNLRRAAQVVVERHGGEFPTERSALEALPGVGPYTARAIAVHAFAAREAPVDTNVRRVLTRVRGGEPGGPELQAYADSLVPVEAAAWANALMDLGATVCRPANIDCAACPLRAWCSTATVGLEASRRAGRSAANAPRFERTNRWLRGRILDAARDVTADGWAAFDRPIGDHERDEVLAMVGVLASEGLLERHASDRTLARLPR
jgi:A/G-specific adenine glycosylase